MKKRVFYKFFDDDLREEVIRTQTIPSGYYDSQDRWNGEEWDTHLFYEGGSFVNNSVYVEGRGLQENEFISW